MYSISEVVNITGFTAHTLRYYEKLGLFTPPEKCNGKRKYSDGDVRLLQFIKVLKHTGMSLDNIYEFLRDGCLLENTNQLDEQELKIKKRMDILRKHLLHVKEQKDELEKVIKLTEEKLETYERMLAD